jgi:hypothetical protein
MLILRPVESIFEVIVPGMDNSPAYTTFTFEIQTIERI